MIKAQWIRIISFRKEKHNWLNWFFAALFYFMAFYHIWFFNITILDFMALLFGTTYLHNACKNSLPTWDLRAPNQTMSNLYKVDDKYVSAATNEEAQLWAHLAGKDVIPDKIGEVYHFEK